VRPIREIRLYDVAPDRAAALAARLGGSAPCHVASTIPEATRGADVIVTCTSGGAYVLDRADVGPGGFVAAVGTDNPHKREIQPRLMAAARVVVDDLAQCLAGGDLHHAVAAGAMVEADVHADLARVVAGRHAPIAASDIVVFDSTGVAIEDAAAADRIYERARELGLGRMLRLDQ
jgi:ornithine cyclodeaminase/alanine dehydrogenase-like protein (mu-crystallin family)